MTEIKTDGKKIVILGGGITGLTAAWRLSQTHGSRVVLVEKSETAGGLAGAVRRGGWTLDLGSHRIHENYDPEALEAIRQLIGADLLRRPRRGLILINGKFLRYPPSIIQTLTAFGPAKSFSFLRDYAASRLSPGALGDNFESYTVGRVGRSLYEDFYKPYAIKLWGLPPDRISHEPAMNRVKKFEWAALRREISSWFRQSRKPFFYYPAGGIGQIAEAIQKRFLENGGILRLGTDVEGLDLSGDRTLERVRLKGPGGPETLDASLVISTVPLDVIHSLVKFEREGGRTPPFELRWRHLRILYLFTADKTPGQNETYYMPNTATVLGRVSEIHKYSPTLGVAGDRVAMTVEIPCWAEDAVWKMDDAGLLRVVWAELEKLGIVRPGSPIPDESFSERIGKLYPVHEIGWRSRCERVIERLHAVENLYVIGRPALFLHCNIDHCMHMAFRLAEHLKSGADRAAWRKRLQTFQHFTVKD